MTGQEKEIFDKVVEFSGKVYSDQTGRLPHSYSRGNKYTMVMYAIDPDRVQDSHEEQ